MSHVLSFFVLILNEKQFFLKYPLTRVSDAEITLRQNSIFEISENMDEENCTVDSGDISTVGADKDELEFNRRPGTRFYE